MSGNTDRNVSASNSQSWRSSMAFPQENTQLASARPRWASATIEKVRYAFEEFENHAPGTFTNLW
jgi:hypothetical protein